MHALRIVTKSALPEDDEIKLVARTDRRAAADLVVRKYRDRLFHHACYILKDYQRAMDVTQDVFIKAMHEDRFFTDEFKMKAWLFRVTSNLCFNIRRDKKRRAAILETVDRPTSTAPNQVDVVFNGQAQQTIMTALNALSDNHKGILMLRYYSDLSYAEIASTLDIKLGTVMSRLSRAKSQLVDVLEDVRIVDA